MSTVIHGLNGVSVENGTATGPTIKGQDSDSGIFFGVDTLDLSTGGTARIGIDDDGNTTVTGNLTATGSISAGSFTGLSGLYNAWAQLVHKQGAGYKIPSEDWETRPLTNKQDPSSIVTLEQTDGTYNGRFTLAAGKYRISWAEHFIDTADAVDRLTTYADSTYTNVDDLYSIGIAQYGHTTDVTSILVTGVTRVEPTEQTTYALRHHVDDNASNYSGGRNTT